MGKLVRDIIDCKISNNHFINLAPINGMDIGEDKKFLLVSCLDSCTRLMDISAGEVVSEYKG